ncbi:hypothetical protein V1508DRAFT_393238 [Lipomyces doorenjongii]|uniref:uncharacterized protein n=1 Tax=Lipomyces doorenjongii TaxID=383834 RepID=UPI0034CE3C29
MSSPVTAIVILNLRPGAAIEQSLRDIFEVFSRQEGFQRITWGRWEESAEKVQLFIDWDNIESHRKFEACGADFQAVGGILKPVLVAPPSMYHVHFSPHPPSEVLSAPIVELVTYYSISATFETDIAKFLSVLEKAVGCVAIAHCGIDEDLAKEDGEPKGKAYLAAIGWSSVDANEKAMTTKEVADAVHLANGEARNVEIRHVKFQAL